MPNVLYLQMEDIAIPILYGDIEAVSANNTTVNGETTNQSIHQQYERESEIEIDYRRLRRNLREIEEEDIKRAMENLHQEINTLIRTIQQIPAPNMRVN